MTDKEVKKLFEWKNDFLLGPESTFDFSEVYLYDFFKYIFSREDDEDPFEEEKSPEYLTWKRKKAELNEKWHQWQASHGEGEKFEDKIDYSDFPFFRYNPIAIEFTDEINPKTGKKVRPVTIITKENQECIDRIEGHDFVICSPVTYVGRNRNSTNARYLYAFTVDLDGVGVKQMKDIMWQMTENTAPKGTKKMTNSFAPVANIIVNSGHGVHLYYLLKKPVPLFQTNVEMLNKLKKSLTNVVWNGFTSALIHRQYQGVLQGFRLPGTKTKFGETIRAFYNHDSELFSLAEINEFTRDEVDGVAALKDDEIKALEKGWYNPKNVTLKEAEKRWPEWYERVIVQGKTEKKHWHIKRDLYDWWLDRLRKDNKIVPGHRYFCMMALAIYAVKCDIPYEELKRDAFELVSKMDSLTTDEDNHFTEDDVEDSLAAYKVGYCAFPKNSIEYLTALRMPEGNRRNGRKQVDHLKRARLLRDLDYPDGQWINRKGRNKESYSNSKTAWKVAAWRYKHPNVSSKSQCSRDLEMSRHTVIKWWDGVEEFKRRTGHVLEGDIDEKKIGEAFRQFL
jgi:hypothetical protein